MVVVGWFMLLSSAHDELDAEHAKEPALKQDYRGKLAQAVNLSELRKQKLQVEEYVTQLEKQLPGKAEMDALLSDINQAGLGRGLQFELFRPGQVAVKDYYAELPIAIQVAGPLSRHRLVRRRHRQPLAHRDAAQPASPRRRKDASGLLSMEATARTYRYLDAAEIEEIAQERGEGQAGSEEMTRLMHRRRSRRAAVRLGAVLQGCADDQDELQQWMEQQRREVKPSVEPLSRAEEVHPAGLRGAERRSSLSARRS